MPIKGGHHTKEAKEKIREYHNDLPMEKHPAWKGGFPRSSNGAISFKLPEGCRFSSMKDKNGYVYIHRLTMAAHLQRTLKFEEVVHHINGNVSDNRIENLRLLKNQGEHIGSYHRSSDGRFSKHREEIKNEKYNDHT